jgi:hypothetical protein
LHTAAVGVPGEVPNRHSTDYATLSKRSETQRQADVLRLRAAAVRCQCRAVPDEAKRVRECKRLIARPAPVWYKSSKRPSKQLLYLVHEHV